MNSENYEENYKNKFDLMLQDFENERLIVLKEFYCWVLLWFIIIPIIILCIFFMTNLEIVSILCLMPIALINYIILFYWYKNKWNKKFINKIKRKNKDNFLNNFDEISWIVNDKSEDKNSTVIPNIKLEKSGLFLEFDSRYNDDEFEGTYKDVSFRISETELIKIVSTNRGNYSTPIFKGIIINFNSNKKIKNRTIISTKFNSTQKSNYVIKNILIAMIIIAALFAIFSGGGGYTGGRLVYHCVVSTVIAIGVIIFLNVGSCWKKPLEPLNKVRLESVDFMKKFDVYSSDEVEARYLVTPSFMERFQNLKTVFGAKVIKCSFYDNNNIMIAIDTKKDFFEVGCLFKSFKDKTTIKRFFNEIESIYSMIDYFKLDQNIKI